MGIKTMRLMDRYEAEALGTPVRSMGRYHYGETPAKQPDWEALLDKKDKEIETLKEDLRKSLELLRDMRKIIEDAGLLKKDTEA